MVEASWRSRRADQKRPPATKIYGSGGSPLDAGVTLTVYTTALRGGRMGPTFGDKESRSGVIGFTDDVVKEARLEHIKKLYLERLLYLDNTTGDWVQTAAVPRIVAVVEDGDIPDGPYA